jgi:tetratricopeptide (TPR) repeat protein
VNALYYQTCRRFPQTLLGVARIALVGMLLASAGCGSIISPGKNAQGVVMFQQARYPEALNEFQEAIYNDPKNADGYYNIAATYHRMGRQQNSESDLQQAEKFYNDCLDRNPNHTECYRGLAVLLAETKRKDAAFRLIQGWVDREPMMADAKVELARLHEEFGDRQMAKNYLIEAVEAQPDHARALAALGKIRDDAGDKTQALANYQRSLSRDSRQPHVASRITALQGGVTSATSGASSGTGAGTPGVLAPPVIEAGTRMADRTSSSVQ